MKTTIEQMQEYLQNAANPLNLTVLIYQDFSDKRKKPQFCVFSGNTSISPKMDYIEANCFLLGYSRAINK